MVALWKHYAKSKSLATKDHLLHDSISMKCPKQANLQRKKVDWWLPGTRGRKKWEGTTSGIGVSFTGDEKILKYYVNILKPTKLCTLNGWIVWYVTYISIKLLLKKKYIWVNKSFIHPLLSVAILLAPVNITLTSIWMPSSQYKFCAAFTCEH